MALQTISGGVLLYPFTDQLNAATPAVAGVTIDSATEYVANIIPIAITGSIAKVGFRTVAVTTPGTGEVRVETVALRVPSGTLVNAGANASIPLTAANTWYTATLGTPATVYAGSAVAVKIEMTTTAGAIGVLQISQWSANVFPGGTLPFSGRFQGTTTTTEAEYYAMALEYSDGTFPTTPGVTPVQTVSSNSYGSASQPDEFGAAFSLPYPTRVVGFWGLFSLSAGTSARMLLYDGDTTTLLATHDIDLNAKRTTTVNAFYFPLASATTLLAASTYRLTAIPLTTSAMILYTLNGSAAPMMAQFPYGNTRFMATSRNNSGAWTDDPRAYPLLGLILEGFGDDVGGAGSTTIVTGGAWGF